MKSFAIIGIGNFGRSVATTLCKLGHEVLAMDISEDRVRDIADHVTAAVQINVTDERAMKQVGIRNFDCVIISVGEDIRASILATVLCKEMGAKHVVAKASDDMHAKILLKTGADSVVRPEHESGVRLARSLVSDSVIDYLDLSDEYSIHEMRIPRVWVDKSIMKIDVRRNYGISIIAIRRGGRIIVAIDPEQPLKADDVLVMIGSNKSLKKVESLGI